MPRAEHPERALERVHGLLEAARVVADPRTAPGARLRRRLAQTTGLSPENIELAFEHALELHPSDAELDALVRSAEPAPRAHVVLPANVFVAAHRALALALASSEHVWVKPSRREPAFVEALVAVAPGLVERVVSGAGYAWSEVGEGDHVWAYASDQTLQALRRALPASAVLHAHGDGFGLAVVDGRAPRAELSAAARALAHDTVLFEQRGCLSPRFVLTLGGEDVALAFATELSRALAELEAAVPLARLEDAEHAARTWYRECSAALGPLFERGASAVRVGELSEPLLVPPNGRNLHVVPTAALEASLRSLAPHVTAVGVSRSALASECARELPWARVGPLGRMHSPPFDGPVDRRSSALRGR